MNNTHNINIWVITEKGLTGTQNQCIGVAEQLNRPYTIKEINSCSPLKALKNFINPERKECSTDGLEPPWPDLIIAGGRKAISACRYIKSQSPTTFCAFMQNPRAYHSTFDLIAAPLHDQLHGENIISTTGAPNRITQETLKQAKKNHQELDAPVTPKVAVLIGGNSKTHRLTNSIIDKLIQQLKTLNAHYMITASRRTSLKHIEKLKNADLNAYIWNGKGDNPYFSILAKADTILVTGDSVSMLSDAGTTGKPTYIIPMEGKSSKFERFYNNLFDKNVARVFDGKLESWNYAPLNDAHIVANAIKTRMDLKE